MEHAKKLQANSQYPLGSQIYIQFNDRKGDSTKGDVVYLGVKPYLANSDLEEIVKNFDYTDKIQLTKAMYEKPDSCTDALYQFGEIRRLVASNHLTFFDENILLVSIIQELSELCKLSVLSSEQLTQYNNAYNKWLNTKDGGSALELRNRILWPWEIMAKILGVSNAGSL